MRREMETTLEASSAAEKLQDNLEEEMVITIIINKETEIEGVEVHILEEAIEDSKKVEDFKEEMGKSPKLQLELFT
jgi:coenzyme F420-reducing hydrogenase gamma subunit